MKMKVKVVSRKLVKPCKPTPPYLRSYKISLLDEINPPYNHPRILYFSSKNGILEPKYVSLEESLAQILPNFYVLAGRYNKEKREVDCEDQGAHFSTAEVDMDLSQIMATDVEPEQLDHLLPVGVTTADELTHPILAIQINRFRCGGLAIGICAAHRVVDTATFALFITAWAKAAASGGAVLTETQFGACSDFLPAEKLPPLDSYDAQTQEKLVMGRLVFDSRAIRALRERLRSDWKSERPPSRVVAVSAFLAQAIIRADQCRHGRARATTVAQVIDVRGRSARPVPKHAFGTWVSACSFDLAAADHSAGGGYAALAAKIYETTAQGVRDCARILGDKEFGRKLIVGNFVDIERKAESGDWKVIWTTDITKFGEYEADFGFGKPDWVSFAWVPLQDHIVLLSNKTNDGIEAWVILQESDMKIFRQDKEIPMLSAMARL